MNIVLQWEDYVGNSVTTSGLIYLQNCLKPGYWKKARNSQAVEFKRAREGESMLRLKSHRITVQDWTEERSRSNSNSELSSVFVEFGAYRTWWNESGSTPKVGKNINTQNIRFTRLYLFNFVGVNICYDEAAALMRSFLLLMLRLTRWMMLWKPLIIICCYLLHLFLSATFGIAVPCLAENWN